MQWQQRDPCMVMGDRELLELARANVLDNAIDFSPRGGCITRGVQPHGAQARLTVRGGGPGIEAQLLPKLGERFFSMPRPAAEGEAARKGSGLGLAIVREVMALHRGSLRISNALPGLQVGLRMALAHALA